MKKKQIRKNMLLKRTSLSKKDIVSKSKAIENKLFSMKKFMERKTVMFYAAMKDEVQTESMIMRALGMGKQIIVPSLSADKNNILPSLLLNYENDLEEGTFGILEPKQENFRFFPAEDIEIVIVPAIAFDRSGGRLGFGGGYYDRFLPKLKPSALHMGLAFEFQVIEKLPLTNADIPVDKIITEEKIINCPATHV